MSLFVILTNAASLCLHFQSAGAQLGALSNSVLLDQAMSHAQAQAMSQSESEGQGMSQSQSEAPLSQSLSGSVSAGKGMSHHTSRSLLRSKLAESAGILRSIREAPSPF